LIFSTWNLERLSAEAGRWALAKADGTWNSSEASESRGRIMSIFVLNSKLGTRNPEPRTVTQSPFVVDP